MTKKKTKTKTNSMKVCIDWSDLNPDLLGVIANKLEIYKDYVRLRAVCVKWRSSISPKPRCLPTQLPRLLFPFSTDKRTDCSFLDLSTKKFYPLSLTESSGSRCCGSSLGWLVFVEECNPTIRLVNPLTKDVIHLPPVTAFPNVLLKFNRSKKGEGYVVKSLSSGSRISYSMKGMRDKFIKKIVLSSSSSSLENDYIALVIFKELGQLAFHKKGVEKWSFIKEAEECFYEDVIYYKRSFYALTTAGSLAICDLNGVSPIVTRVTLSSIPSDRLCYLVDISGELTLVTRKIQSVDIVYDSDNDIDYDSDNDHENDPINETVDSSLFTYDSSEQQWVQMDSLDDHMLFLGGNSPVCLSASDFSGSCKRNSIYYSSDVHQDIAVHGIYDCVVHRLDDKVKPDDKIKPLSNAPDIGLQHILHPSIWVTPNPCMLSWKP